MVLSHWAGIRRFIGVRHNLAEERCSRLFNIIVVVKQNLTTYVCGAHVEPEEGFCEVAGGFISLFFVWVFTGTCHVIRLSGFGFSPRFAGETVLGRTGKIF
ncbi:MAG: hypothetical protein DWI00_14330 [Planctomycetota bacterium]|nr:MAG: hypothetical protein DWI00_14330 [Planctomycetota bacterium]